MTDSKDFIDLIDRVVAVLTKKEIEEVETTIELEALIASKFFGGRGEQAGNVITKTGDHVSELLAKEIASDAEHISDEDRGKVILVPRVRAIKDDMGFYDNFKITYDRETPKPRQVQKLEEINRKNEEYAGELSRMNLDQLSAFVEAKKLLVKKGYALSDKLAKTYRIDDKGRVRIMWKAQPKIVGRRVTAITYNFFTPKQIRGYVRRMRKKA